YVQPYPNNIHQTIKIALKAGKKVLASGSPCMISSLLRFLAAETISTENLTTIDIICSNVPSPAYWHDFITHKKFENLLWVDFRDKRYSRQCTTQCYYTKEKGRIVDNTWGRIFNSFLACNPACFKCRYKKMERVSDITIGDFWGIEKIRPDLDASNGINIALVNTNKGQTLFDSIVNDTYHLEIDKGQAEYYRQKSLNENWQIPKEYESFWKRYSNRGFVSAQKKYFDEPYYQKIARFLKRAIHYFLRLVRN
nr:Coenzyme F420 hydrogenase/dehydrogenase, beta subunit C-terminal domain [Bacilli bacterium]